MSGLARSLVDAAAEAICPVASVEFMVDDSAEPCWTPQEWQKEARAAVAAVLETLAAHITNQPVELADLMGHGIPFNEGKASVVDLMRRLATEVREVS